MERLKPAGFEPIAHFRGRLAGRRRFRRRRGATTVEFAIVAVPFLGLLTAIFETGFVYFENAQLQEVTETASRSLLTNALASGITYQTFLTNNVCPKLSKMIVCANLQMEIDVVGSTWNNASNYTQNNIYSGTYNASQVFTMPQPGQIAIVRIVYPMSPMATILTGGAFGGGGQIRNVTSGMQQDVNNNMVNMLMGIYAFKVEP
ncbi:TadE/TadG family type IV pilus assembly protein [Methylocystis heyeri]|uniref:Pilus assembly protein n=1 Tax=Methylocystis heyeri TaxID=391905 RepID=A0A6B8KI29_9HYPH|nr:TadE/TadG family type IV pilus assembly protein [Methylocystis heyeri]QGM46168.1 pilus assembly protein [Methylocystis heyeri]